MQGLPKMYTVIHGYLLECVNIFGHPFIYTGRGTKCHSIDCTHNKFLLLQKHLTSGTELILIGRKIVPNESL